MQLGESMEDYLEAILVLSKCLDHVRSVDVASYLGFSVVRQLYIRKYSKCRLCRAFFMSNFLFILLYGCCTAL